jgi:hypothetical protein
MVVSQPLRYLAGSVKQNRYVTHLLSTAYITYFFNQTIKTRESEEQISEDEPQVSFEDKLGSAAKFTLLT